MFSFANQSSAGAPSAGLAAGSIVGIWRIGPKLASGPRHELYATQPADAIENPRWDYVIKLAAIAPLSPSARNGSRTTSAAVTASVVKHPNLVSIVDASMSASPPYVVMPRLQGVDLQEKCATGTDIVPSMIVWWARQIAEALESLHADRIVHGDVHPRHIWIAPTGHATLLDLGQSAPQLTPFSLAFRGTAPFAAPELSAGKTAAIPEMDIHALGKVMLHCLKSMRGIDSELVHWMDLMTSIDPYSRPSAHAVVSALRKLELKALVQQIRPTAVPRTTRRAA